jgi:hypothetical protein
MMFHPLASLGLSSISPLLWFCTEGFGFGFASRALATEVSSGVHLRIQHRVVI